MAYLGVGAAVDLVTPTGVDGAEIFKFKVLREGKKTALELLQQVAAIIGTVNEGLINRYGSLMTITDEMYGMYRQGESTRSMTPPATEFTEADAVRSDWIGHMLPLKMYEDALGWSKMYLLNANSSQIRNDMDLIAERWQNRFDYEFITRILTDTEEPIGSNGYSVGWAIGSGMNVNYIPPQWRENVFDDTHTHYIVKDSSNGDTFEDLLETMVEEHRHHGHSGRLYALVSEDDLDTIAALPRFVELVPSELSVVGSSTNVSYYTRGEFEGVPGELFGFYKSKRGLVELYYHGRVPEGYAFMTKPYGRLNSRNGVAIRRHPSVPFGLRHDVVITRSINPTLEKVKFDAMFGVGVNDRLNGVAGLIADGAESWVNPTIT